MTIPDYRALAVSARKADGKYLQLGSTYHQYRFWKKLSKEALQRFESAFHVQLPEDYRTFLRAAGNGGAGPFYGVSPLEDWVPPDLEDVQRLLERPFPHTEAWNDRSLFNDSNGSTATPYLDNSLTSGALRICNAGCESYYLLVVSGSAKGTVWRDARVDGEGIFPVRGHDGSPLTFAGWYALWSQNVQKGEDYVVRMWTRDPPSQVEDLPASVYGVREHHVTPKIVSDLGTDLPGEGQYSLVVSEQFPCPACYKLLRTRLQHRFRYIVPQDPNRPHRNPKRASIEAAKYKTPVELISVFEKPRRWWEILLDG